MTESRRWSKKTHKRADREHARKRRTRQQKQHLVEIKSETELRQMRLNGRRRQR